MVRLSEDAKMELTILLSGHADVVHTYLFPGASRVAEGLAKMKEVNDQINLALTGTVPFVSLENPLAVYAIRHVIGSRVEFDSAETEQAFAEYTRQIGFPGESPRT